MEAGDPVRADGMLEAVYRARREQLAPGHPDLLILQYNLAGSRIELGDYVGAIELAEEVVAEGERTLPAGDVDRIRFRATLAQAHHGAGHFARARELAESVLEDYEQVLPTDHPELVLAKDNLAVMRNEDGDLAGALELKEEVHATQERLRPAGHPDLLRAKHNLAAVLRRAGELERARALQETVHSHFARVLPPDHPNLMRAQANLALTRMELGDREGADAMARELLESLLASARALDRESPRVARSRALKDLAWLDNVLLAIRYDNETPSAELEELLFSALESLRAVSTGSANPMLGVREAPELEAGRVALRRIRAELNDLAVRPPAASELDAWTERLLELSDERDHLERELRQGLTGHGARLATPTVRGAAAALEPDAALVTFLRYGRYLEKGRPPVDSLLAFVLSADAGARARRAGAERGARVARGGVARIAGPSDRHARSRWCGRRRNGEVTEDRARARRTRPGAPRRSLPRRPRHAPGHTARRTRRPAPPRTARGTAVGTRASAWARSYRCAGRPRRWV